MIEPYITEQYLPCKQLELFGVDKRKTLHLEGTLVGLKNDIIVLPMHRGFLLHVKGGGLLYADEHAIDTLRGLAGSYGDGKISNSDALYKPELERLNYYGLLSFDGITRGKLYVKSVPDEVRRIYSTNEYGWFSYVPTKIELDLSSFCNFSCIHCSRNASPHISPDRQELTIDELRQVVSDAAKVGVISLQLMGGEPLAYKHFFEICECAISSGIHHLNTSSNGWLINKEIASRLAGFFSEVQLSLHGGTSNTHDSIVGNRGAWKRVGQAAKNLIDCGVNVRLSFTVMEQNVGEIEIMPDIARSMGASSLRFLALSNQGRGKNLKELTQEDRADIGKRIKSLAAQEQERRSDIVKIECGGFPPLTELRTNAQFYGCPAGRDLLYIGADGSVACCGVIESFVGNIRDMSILQLWHHPKMVQVRKAPRCDCEFKLICSGPCIAGFAKPYEDKVKII